MNDFYSWKDLRQDSKLFSRLITNPVAYFCMEFALPDNLPIYAGGLGVLAGDYIMEAAEQGFPMVAIGLFYSEKCYPNDLGGVCIPSDPVKLGLKPVLDKLGQRIKISLPIGKSTVKLQAWHYQNGTIPLYLLDSNLSENNKEDREILRLLYASDPVIRLKQELILGIGGVRLLQKLNISPAIYHMNEGHSAFLSFELADREMRENNLDFRTAFDKSSRKIAYTNHTLVVGGHDVFNKKLVEEQIKSYAKEIRVNPALLLELGTEKSNKKIFSTTFLALNSASRINTVSVYHAKQAKKFWPSYPTIAITNGVNIKRWDKITGSGDVLTRHKANKKQLLQYIRKEAGVNWSENDLMVGWARRIVGYKRPVSLFDDLNKIKELASNRKNPLRLVFSGQPHYQDVEGLWLLGRLRKLAKEELRGNMVFLEKYSTDISSLMIAGCDVWLNTPIVGQEACGTSGMKAALNGTLQCSTNDGWLREVELEKIGYELDDKYVSLSLIDTLTNRIIPEYYQHKRGGSANSVWKKEMELSRGTILSRFGSDRMLADYIKKIYWPILNQAS